MGKIPSPRSTWPLRRALLLRFLRRHLPEGAAARMALLGFAFTLAFWLAAALWVRL